MKLSGVLFFPVTPFGPDGTVDQEALATHISLGVNSGAGAVFAACGTGEFHALAPAEIGVCAQVAVTAAAGRVPVVVAAGGPLPLVREQTRRIRESGADGVLLLPPYLVQSPQQGLVRYVREAVEAAGLPVIVYQRGNAVLTPETALTLAQIPGVVGIKDGVGDLELMHRTVRAVRGERDGFQFFNGLPTAEMTMHAYRGLGVSLYSSAVFAFAPEIAIAFHRAFTSGDEATARLLLDEFYAPLVELRGHQPGYAVSLVKAGVRIRGLETGGVRAPLLDPAPEDLERLEKLLDHGL
ncbi:5-dehydro-4-deoxyglucarate dehydratase [Streptomyces sp. NBC_00878]|uniref:5-dehydro-4-deoxyglucarate dehydratase n=1 Tax=Streptomyces sp. NBC_00878 TaxID=2975854 RepID=UPI002259F7BE|nr:5-dehydro-4-deoxyglucarate dehydratase [Streptomyces sp. NBC_00878]MCX4908171.1 5-dehydro-4-deoxyglucarate dehydratase [Streptomyces sp. NBC_00878]